MNLRRLIAPTVLVVTLLAGCGALEDTSRITDTQAENLVDSANPSVVALHDAGYVALTKQDDDQPSIMFRKCSENSTTENCRNNGEPSVTAPDVYLAVKNANANHLAPTGKYDLLFAASAHSNPANGLHCKPLSRGKLTQANVSAFADIGKQFHDLYYKTTEGGSPTQTKEVGAVTLRCSVTFGQYL